jgi:signal peptidase I
MIDKRKANLNMKKQWTKFIIVLVLYLLFLFWVKSWLGLIVVPFIYDIYITKKIKWQWWKDSEKPVRVLMSWVDAIIFALVAVYFINLFFFQNYVIPSSSLEKSLLRGDYLFVSKLSYGPRIPQTPLTMPLTQHTLPVFGTKSYIEWPQWKYRRVSGLGQVEQNDIVVFNYPAGDTVMSNERYQAQDYYQYCYAYGVQNTSTNVAVDSMSAQQRWDYYQTVMRTGAEIVKSNPAEFGEIITRPADRRENYVKRCVGLPGQKLQIINQKIFIDGKETKEPDNVQFSYFVRLKQMIPDATLEELSITMEDIQSMNVNGYMPMTKKAAEALSKMTNYVEYVRPVTDADHMDTGKTYPVNGNYGWTRDNYGPIWIPAKGQSVKLTMDNIAIYDRPIRVYEGNDLQVRDGKIFINGKEAQEYTFQMDYYWMMGDNRHNSADSRYWGFVPEDHVVGKPIFIWLSINPEDLGPKIRWKRMFRMVDNIR